MIKDLSDIGLGDAARFGGKAAALGEMSRRGIPVPPGAAEVFETGDLAELNGAREELRLVKRRDV